MNNKQMKLFDDKVPDGQPGQTFEQEKQKADESEFLYPGFPT